MVSLSLSNLYLTHFFISHTQYSRRNVAKLVTWRNVASGTRCALDAPHEVYGEQVPFHSLSLYITIVRHVMVNEMGWDVFPECYFVGKTFETVCHCIGCIRLILALFLFAFMGGWSIMNSAESGPAFQVTLSLAACIYFLHEKSKSLGRAFIIGFGALATGWVLWLIGDPQCSNFFPTSFVDT